MADPSSSSSPFPAAAKALQIDATKANIDILPGDVTSHAPPSAELLQDRKAGQLPRRPSEPSSPEGRTRPLFARRHNSRQLSWSITDRTHDEPNGETPHRWRSGRLLSFSRTRADDGNASPDARSTHSSTRLALDTAEGPRRASIPGAKPVAPSWHPDAPDEIKVRSPIDSVLLPELPLAGTSNGAGSKGGITVEDRILSSSSQMPPLEAQRVLDSDSVKLQRPSIKVRVITWNQGNSVPKGDLGVLLGRVGEYIAPESGWDESGDEEEEEASEHALNARNGAAAVGDEAARATKPKRHRGMGVAGQENVARKDRIPPLPHDDAHPYHVIVIAGQECPWGDGKRIATSVGMAGELGDLGRSKSRAAYIAKEREREARAKEKEKEREREAQDGGGKTPGLLITGADEDDPFFSGEAVAQSPMIGAQPATPGALMKGRAGGRGWGEMCEDWLCRGPLAQATATKGLALASSSACDAVSAVQTPDGGSSPVPTRSPTPNRMGRGEWLADSSRASSIDDLRQSAARSPNVSTTHLSDALGQPGAASPARRKALNVPRVIRSISRPRLDSDATTRKAASPLKIDLADIAVLPASLSNTDLAGVGAPAVSAAQQHVSALTSVHEGAAKGQAASGEEGKAGQQGGGGGGGSKAHHRLAIRIPGLSGSHHVTVQSDGTPASLGPYELVCKERCYMMYTAVYVWRGCLDRVHGVSQGHVKSGLLAGRVGNKGAVGISLKLGESRLLFVNAHLAAHEGKVAERIANVEKIKKELKVDTFLPKDDPRNDVDDLAACFDYAFWLGDLNFRVDITRRHADWLMMKKQYDHALAFDQLRRIMKEQPEVFNGYREAPITFPPTFKYDVLKTIKAKKLEEKIHKQSAATMADGMNGQASSAAGMMLRTLSSGSLELPRATSIDMLSTSPKAQDGNIVVAPACAENDDDASSISSSAVNSSSFGGYASEPDDASMPTSPETGPSPTSKSPIDLVVAHNTAAVEGLGLHGRVIKVRRRLLNVVQSAVVAVASPGGGGAGEDTKRPNTEQNRARHSSLQIAKVTSDPSSVLHNSTSMSSVTGGAALTDAQQAHSKPRRHTNTILYQPLTAAAAVVDPSSDSAELDANLRRTSDPHTSVITFADGEKGDSSSVQQGDFATSPPEEGDNWKEKQLYDTSAKQRVPSWCDRVLWRSNVTVELDDGEEDADEVMPAPESSRASRFTAAISSALSRLHVRHDTLDGTRQMAASADMPFTRAHTTSAIPSDGPTPITSVAAPSPSSPRRKWYARRRMTSDSSNPPPTSPRSPFKRSATFAHDFPTRSDSVQGRRRMTKRTHSAHDIPVVTTNGNAVAEADSTDTASSQQPRTPGNKNTRLRVLSSPDVRRLTSFQVDLQRRHDVSLSAAVRQADGKTTELPGRISRRVSEKKLPPLPSPPLTSSSSAVPEQPRKHSRWTDFLSQLSNPQVPTTSALANFAFGGTANGTAGDGSEASNHVRHATHAEAEQAQLQVEEEQKEAQDKVEREAAYARLIGPRRGEVECLLYKSLDDREMRLLEGRSDHRPVIFVGSIGVGHARAAK